MPFEEEPIADPGDQATLTLKTPVIARYVRIVVIAGLSAVNAGVLDTCVPCAVGKYTCSNTTTRSAICVEGLCSKGDRTFAVFIRHQVSFGKERSFQRHFSKSDRTFEGAHQSQPLPCV